MLKKDRQLLLKLARETLEAYFKDLDPDTSDYTHLTQLKGCFVTLYKKGELRGCIGFVKPIMPLFEQVIAATKAAAFEDPRFEPVVEEELKNIKIEISILNKPELIKAESQEDYIKNINIGRDGLIIQFNGHSGLLLPQVAQEYHWTPVQFLEALSEKAGLNRDAWKHKDAKIYRFTAEVFSE
ncbi:MAG: AMMECR1 domain-containing protein [Candidatus Woesearchaeota archaeon]|nr:MAG: AMMECR1 domain-containing protein [Candidatus Woesearchaeota archaeon]